MNNIEYELNLIDNDFFRVPKRLIKKAITDQRTQQFINTNTKKIIDVVKYKLQKKVIIYLSSSLLGVNTFFITALLDFYNNRKNIYEIVFIDYYK